MPIEGFDFKEFAKNLADQASQVIPDDIQGNDRQYVVNIVYNFCYMAGEALANDANLNFNAEQASIITQFIGEWAFHKSIDLIKGGIDPQFRDGILQKIAFTVFEIGKQAILKQLPQADMISIVEHHVRKAYQESLEELKAKGAISDEQLDEAAHHSNIDDMAKQVHEEAVAAQEAADNSIAQVSDNKILKLATLAMVVKRLPQKKKQAVLDKIEKEDAQIVEEYAQMEGLEDKIDKNVTIKCLQEIRECLPEPRHINTDRLYERLYNIVKNSDVSKISNIIGKERTVVKKFVLGAADDKNYDIAPRVGEVVCQYLEEKLG